jgi:hypothetical protein
VASLMGLAWVADTLPANSSDGGCGQNATPAVAYEFAHACAADTQCNGTHCLATLAPTDSACASGSGVLTCTAACTVDTDCQQYNAAKCGLCSADGGTRVCIPH